MNPSNSRRFAVVAYVQTVGPYPVLRFIGKKRRREPKK
jgi:hypothetical protein